MYVTADGVLVMSENDDTPVFEITLADLSARLKQFGYVVVESDMAQLSFEMEKLCDYVLNYCNITSIPTILNRRIIDRICCEFLFNKKNSGELEGFNYDAAIKEIKEGDTTLKYVSGAEGETTESRFDKLLARMERGFDKWLAPHRRLRW